MSAAQVRQGPSAPMAAGAIRDRGRAQALLYCRTMRILSPQAAAVTPIWAWP
jgi:hypothetical protein